MDDFISPHQADVTLDIGGENRGELPFDGVRFQPSAPPNREYIPTSFEIRGILSHYEDRW